VYTYMFEYDYDDDLKLANKVLCIHVYICV